jgi:parvulin-like peptidyl-prolyl isomerase
MTFNWEATKMRQATTLFSLICILTVLMGCSRQESKKANRLPDGRVQPEPDEVLVSIDGNALTYADAIRLVKLRLGGPPPEGMPREQVEAIERRTFAIVVDDFIRRELLLAEARRLGIEADEEKVTYALEALKKSKQEGTPEPSGFVKEGPDSLREEVVTGLMIETLLAQKLPPFETPSDEELETYLEQHPKLRMIPASAKARNIFLALPEHATESEVEQANAKMLDIRKQIEEGADFGQVAQTVSQDGTATYGGNMGTIIQGNGDPAIQQAVFSQEVGSIGSIVRSQSGLHIIEVLARKDPRPAKKEEIIAVMRKNHRAEELGKFLKDIRQRTEILHSPLFHPAGENQAESQ